MIAAKIWALRVCGQKLGVKIEQGRQDLSLVAYLTLLHHSKVPSKVP